MARRRSEYVHVPLLDWLMTLGFLLLCASLARSLLRAGEAALFCIALLTAHAMVGRLREGADVFASWCGARAAARGMVSANPFASMNSTLCGCSKHRDGQRGWSSTRMVKWRQVMVYQWKEA
jgi:hypothetical protein